ncbi:MAG: DUF2336 domain-containing protein [Alphaproteobacteria bacterium]|jgi:uncharacterized protein (DUF2336 family)|nr:DUF2336 domain-containing protein [Alphaproteobacteria bacterium]MDP6567681.1 DUF2336 domain-containing protein [Alphaproteobacteria bacterium]MDP6814543.1 DUF2336 domain-containing protein [Alphaproteobacteria bacterium]
MLKSLFKRGGAMLSYEEQRDRVGRDNSSERLRLAEGRDTRPEILYYLAEDTAPEVRRAIAGNPATPPQADAALVADSDDQVRCLLAEKIGRLAPELPAGEKQKAEALTLSVLEALATDQLPKVRAIVAEHLKCADHVPKHIIRRLAEDLETIVASPVLQFSPLLNDRDLLEIIAAGRAEGALTAIARRQGLTGDVAEAVARGGDVQAVTTLLANDSAQLREDTLDWIIDQAADVEPWHEPLVRRPTLSDGAVRRIAGFVAASLVEVLCQRNDVDAATAQELSHVVRDAMAPADQEPEEAAGKGGATKLFESGALDDEAMQDAIERGDRAFALTGLALKSGLPLDRVRGVMEAADPRAITALTWKADLSMRTAMQLQLRLGHVRPQNILNARDGIDYPLSPQELRRELEMLT